MHHIFYIKQHPMVLFVYEKTVMSYHQLKFLTWRKKKIKRNGLLELPAFIPLGCS